MKVIVTCGPSYEPVDEVRRITNFSSGELGILLTRALVEAGYETVCLRGVAATFPGSAAGASLRPFTTNDDLMRQLEELAEMGEVTGIFHAAALCDFRVARVEDSAGREMIRAKIASRAGALTIRLEPAAKVISHLRAWFPRSMIVGWKYEIEGTRAAAIEKGRSQIIENRTDACVVNGRGYGEGFGVVNAAAAGVVELADKVELCRHLVAKLRAG